jgi:Lrp/AsnC family transcriptional regulator for asnA, asnC and gidA
MAPQTPFDQLSLRILEQLQDDGRLSYREIGKRLGVAPGTVRARVAQLVEEGGLEIVAVPNPWRMGLAFFAVVGLRLEAGHADEVADALAAREEVTWVGLVATGYDVMLEIALQDAQAFGRYKEDVLARLPGYVSSDVFLLWDIRKLRYRLVDGLAADEPGTAARDVA